MDEERRSRLARLLKNSSRFLWGVCPGKQKENFIWLETHFISSHSGEKKVEHLQGSYEHVTDLLLKAYGIEKIARFLEATVKKNIDEDLLDYLRECWHDGRKPEIERMEEYSAYTRYAKRFLTVQGKIRKFERFESLITALVDVNPQAIPNTANPIKYRMAVSGFGDFAYVLFEELEASPQYDDELLSDEELRKHAEELGISVESLREARRLDQQAIQDLLAELTGVLDRRNTQGPMEIKLLVSDSGEVCATCHRIKKYAP